MEISTVGQVEDGWNESLGPAHVWIPRLLPCHAKHLDCANSSETSQLPVLVSRRRDKPVMATETVRTTSSPSLAHTR